MSLVELLRKEAVRRALLPPKATIDPATAFRLVRDMPYRRASDRQPQTIIREWCGTCSGKHYLLKALFAELGLPATVMACTVSVRPDPATLPPPLAEILQQSDGVFVDVHNYLLVHLPDGDMIVDATWPLSAQKYGFVVNENFRLGDDQRIASEPLASWPVPEDEDPQAFKQRLLQKHFSPAQLAARDAFIVALSRMLASQETPAS